MHDLAPDIHRRDHVAVGRHASRKVSWLGASRLPRRRQLAKQRSGSSVPNFDDTVAAGTDEPCAIGAVDRVVDDIAVRQREQQLVGLRIPDLRAAVVGSDHLAAIGGEGRRPHGSRGAGEARALGHPWGQSA